MPDIFDRVAPKKKGDIFDKVSEVSPEGDIFDKATRGRTYGVTGTWEDPAELFRKHQRAIGTPEEEIAAELGGIREPWLDPVTAGAAGFGGAGAQALRQGSKLLPAVGKGLLGAFTAAVTDYPIGQAAESIGEKHPKLAFPFALGTGLLSGMALESPIERAIIKKLPKLFRSGRGDIPKAVQEAVEKVTEVAPAAPRVRVPEPTLRPVEKIPKEIPPEEVKAIQQLKLKKVSPKVPPVKPSPDVVARLEHISSRIEGGEYPTWFQNKGYKRKATLAAIKKAIKGEELTVPQADLVDDLLKSSAKEFKKAGRISIKAKGKIAAGGLAHGQELPKYAGSINLERVGADYSVKKFISDMADRYKGTIDEARRGEITHAETEKLANDLGMTFESLMKRRKGQAFNAEEVKAARDILNSSAKRVRGELQAKAAETGSAEDLAKFRLALEQNALVLAEVSAIATESGRALSAHRMISAQRHLAAKNYKAMLDALGGRELTEEIVKRMSRIDPDNQREVNAFIRGVSKAKTTDMVFEAWIMALLSGLPTQVVNATSSALVFLSRFPEKAGEASIDFFRAGLTGTERKVLYGELPHHIFGAWQGLKEGVRKGISAFVSEMPSGGISKLDIAPGKYQAIPSKIFRAGKERKVISVKGRKIPVPLTGEIQIGGKQIRIPGRTLIAVDEFFKAVNYTSEIHALAYRQAVREGIKGKARAKRIAEIIQNPSDELKSKATGEMLYRVFQKDLGPGGKAFQEVRAKIPGLRYIIPFLRVAINIAKFGLERTPLNYGRIFGKMLKGAYTESAREGIKGKARAKRFGKIIQETMRKGEFEGLQLSEELAKTTFGSLVGAAAFMYAKEGFITGGGPRNKAEREAKYRTGWQPYSIKIGDTYYSYQRLEPSGMVLGISADASEIWDSMSKDEKKDIPSLIATSIGQNFLNKTFMRGLSDAFNAIADPARYGETWTKRFISTAVPTGAATAARAKDPTLREARTILDSLKARIPGQRESLLPRRDIWGNEIVAGEGGFLERMVSPVYRAKEKGTKADREIARLKAYIGKPSKTIRGMELTPEQYDELMVKGGGLAKKWIDDFVSSSSYDRIKDEDKAKRIKNLYRKAMDIERIKLYHKIKRGQ